MKNNEKTESMLRRDFLRGMAGGAVALGTGQLLSSTPAAAATRVPFRLFVSTFLAASVVEVEQRADGSVTQRTFAQFDRDERGRVETAAGVVVGPNDNLFVFSPGSDQIFMLDINTGERKRTISLPFLTTSHQGAIGPDGLMYVVFAPSIAAVSGTSRPDSIERFDPATGDHIDRWVDTSTVPAVRAPFGLTWGPDGDLYVTSVLAYGFDPKDFPFRSDHIARLDGTSGRFKGFVVRDQHLSFTTTFHPNGRFLVPSHFFHRVYSYDTSRARLVDSFVDVNYPIGVAYGPDGDLYVASFTDEEHIQHLLDRVPTNDIRAQGAGSIVRFNGKSGGRTHSTIVSGLPFAGYIAFA